MSRHSPTDLSVCTAPVNSARARWSSEKEHKDGDGDAVAWFEALADELEQKYGEKPSVLQGRHHARYHRADVPYHIVSRTFQGRLLLTPNHNFRRLAAGVIARAQRNNKSIKLYAYAFLGNHFHLKLQGEPNEIPKFVRFIKAELTRRWGPERGWSGTLWHDTYLSTALPTEESQLRCFEYILAQGVKEGLAGAPEEWQGLHMARQLFTEEPFIGEWFNGTKYGKARYKDEKRKKPRGVNKAEFTQEITGMLHRPPFWAGLSDECYRAELDAMRSRIVARGEQLRDGKPPPAPEAVVAMCDDLERAYSLPCAPWWEDRRRLIAWADPRAPETRSYLRGYWAFQREFATASSRWCRGDERAVFPDDSFRPGRFEPPSTASPPAPLSSL